MEVLGLGPAELCPRLTCALQVRLVLSQPPLGPFKEACVYVGGAMLLFIMATPWGLLHVALVLLLSRPGQWGAFGS